MTRREYLKHRRELTRLARSMGTQITLRWLPLRMPEHWGVGGAFYSETNRINIEIYGNQAYLLVLVVLAHEVRHAQHLHLGLFRDYYDSRFQEKGYVQAVLKGDRKAPDMKIAVRAERDCDRWAREWLGARGLHLNPARSSHRLLLSPYPMWKTCVYSSHLIIKHMRRTAEAA